MTKVNLEVVKPWITQRVTEVLGFEDDVVIEFVFNQLEEKVDGRSSLSLHTCYSYVLDVFCFLGG